MKREVYEQKREELKVNLAKYLHGCDISGTVLMSVRVDKIIELCAPINELDRLNKKSVERVAILPLDEFRKNMEL